MIFVEKIMFIIIIKKIIIFEFELNDYVYNSQDLSLCHTVDQ